MDFGNLTGEQKAVAQAIAEEARNMNIDPELALAVGWQESRFQPNVIGPKTRFGHAIGPMQIMESNASGLGLDPHELHDVKTNIRAGIRLLRENLKRFGGNERAALVAYNARPSIAMQFVEGNEDLSVLPEETKKYLQNVNQARPLGMASLNTNAFGDVPQIDQFEAPAGRAPQQGSEEPREPSGNAFGEVPQIGDIEPEKPTARKPAGLGERMATAAGDILSNEDRAIAGGVGAVAGAMAGTAGSMKINMLEERAQRARDALADAKVNLQTAASAAQTRGSSAAELLAKAEGDLAAKQKTLANLEKALEQAKSAAAALEPPPAGGGGAYNYAKAFGASDIDAARAVDMSKGPGGAWDEMSKGRQQEAKVQKMMPGAKPVPSAGNIYLPPELAAEKIATSESARSLAGQKVSDLQAQADAARSEVESARKLRESAEKGMGKAKIATTEDLIAASNRQAAAQEAARKAQEAMPGRVGRAGIAAQKVAGKTIGALSGLGLGLSAYDIVDAYQKGDKGRMVSSGIDIILNGMAALPPATPVTAFLKALGIGGSAAKLLIDLYSSRKPQESRPQQPRVPTGGPLASVSGLRRDEYGRYHM